MQIVSNSRLKQISGGSECGVKYVDYREAYNIPDDMMAPAMMVPVDACTGELVEIPTYSFKSE